LVKTNWQEVKNMADFKFPISAAALAAIAIFLLNQGFELLKANITNIYGWICLVVGVVLLFVTAYLIQQGFIEKLEQLKKELHR